MNSRKEQQDLRLRLQQCGINIVGLEKKKKHIKIFIEAGGTKCFIIVGSTISDHRAVKNIVSYAKRNICEARQKRHKEKGS